LSIKKEKKEKKKNPMVGRGTMQSPPVNLSIKTNVLGHSTSLMVNQVSSNLKMW